MEEVWLYFYFFVFSSFKHRVKSILTQIDSNRFFDQIFSRLSIALNSFFFLINFVSKNVIKMSFSIHRDIFITLEKENHKKKEEETRPTRIEKCHHQPSRKSTASGTSS